MPGRVFNQRGGHVTARRYKGGTIFVDAATGYTRVFMQEAFTAEETLHSKAEFERDAAQSGICLKNYNTDNGVYTAAEFMQNLLEHKQGIRVAGVGAHHGNGLAEVSIKHVSNCARTMILHAALRWPDMVNRALWPFAIQHAAHLHNIVPAAGQEWTPEELWTQTQSSHSGLRNAHVGMAGLCPGPEHARRRAHPALEAPVTPRCVHGSQPHP